MEVVLGLVLARVGNVFVQVGNAQIVNLNLFLQVPTIILLLPREKGLLVMFLATVNSFCTLNIYGCYGVQGDDSRLLGDWNGCSSRDGSRRSWKMSWVRLEMLRFCISNLFLLVPTPILLLLREKWLLVIFGNRQLLAGSKYGCYDVQGDNVFPSIYVEGDRRLISWKGEKYLKLGESLGVFFEGKEGRV